MKSLGNLNSPTVTLHYQGLACYICWRERYYLANELCYAGLTCISHLVSGTFLGKKSLGNPASEDS